MKWKIAKGLRLETVTKDFLSSNVPKNITIYTQESLGTRILETQVIKRDDLSVTILKVEILMMMGIVMTAMTALQLSTRLLMTSVMKMSMVLRMLF